MFKEWQEQEYKIILLSGTETKGKNVCKELEKENKKLKIDDCKYNIK